MESPAWGLYYKLLESEKAKDLQRKTKNMNALVLANKISDVGRVSADSAKNYSRDFTVMSFRKNIKNTVAQTGYSGITFRKAGKLRELNLHANVVVFAQNWSLIQEMLGLHPDHNILHNLDLLMRCPNLRQ